MLRQQGGRRHSMLATDFRGRRGKVGTAQRMGVLLPWTALPRGLRNCLLGHGGEGGRVWLASAVQVGRWGDCSRLLPKVSDLPQRQNRTTNLSSSGYGCANVNGQTCTMVALTTMPTVTCGGGGFAFLTIPNAQASITPLSLFAPMIQINWQSSDRSEPTSTTLPTNTKTGESERVTMSGIRTIDTGVETGIETLNLDTNPPTTGAVTYDFGGGSAATATSSLQEQETSPGSEGGLPSAAKVGLGVAGAAVVLVMLVIALFYCLRKRKNQREEQELDHLYGMRHVASPGSGLTASNDIPGWYRGQKLETPAKDPFRDSTRQVKVPTAPYYPRYRP